MKFLKYWGPTFTWMAVIFYFSSRQKLQVSESFAIQFLFFKTLHVIEYAFLYVLVYRSFRNTTKAVLWKQLYQALLLTLLYATSDEIHQLFVPTREGHIRDILIDLLGMTIALLGIWKLLPQVPKPLKRLAKTLELV